MSKRRNFLAGYQRYRPGTLAPVTGHYAMAGPCGADLGIVRLVEKGKPLPPVPKPGLKYALVVLLDAGGKVIEPVKEAAD